ncbi:metalloregulator ArsR/SmtB family transcription factor [Microbacterium sp.]|uniref:ArsR/SmtB family transcription factor n=1 Tax=Microbacterium sp. TaxID=51671 RepID=UPI002810E8C9|nr:metalloregulator ArsR/SmtB family transcription factor [Microbacterium sp.]
MDDFAVIADPTRRAIIERLHRREHDVGALVDALGISQSLASKHLRVLRQAGVVEAAAVGKRRVYRLTDRPMPEVIAWVRPYVSRWADSFDRLAEALDAVEEREDD